MRILLLCSLLVACASAQMPKLPNGVKAVSAVKAEQHPWGTLRVYYEGKTDEVAYMNSGTVTLKPGQEPHPPHTHVEEEFLLITAGSGEMVIDGKTVKVSEGAMMFSAPNKSHGIKNTGKVPLEFFYCKWRR